MNTDTIIRLLENSGFHELRVDGTQILLEDPSCVLRSFQTFAEFAWVAITVATGLMLTGWAISMIRGGKNDIFNNLKNLILVLGGISAVGAIVNFIYGRDIFAIGCKTVSIPIEEVNKMLDARKQKLGKDSTDLYEQLDIYDTGPTEVATVQNDTETEEVKLGDVLTELEKYETPQTPQQPTEQQSF